MQRNSFVLGFAIGAIVPVLGYVVIEQIINFLIQMGLMEAATISGMEKRERFILLMAICTNIFSVQWAKRQGYDSTIKGIVTATLVYSGAWIYTYFAVLYQ